MEIYVLIDSEWVNVTKYAENKYSNVLSLGISQPTVNTQTITYSGENIKWLVVAHEVKAIENGSVRFWGYVDQNISVVYDTDSFQSIKIKYYDFSKKLTEKIDDFEIQETKVSGVISQLFDKVNLANGTDYTLVDNYVNDNIVSVVFTGDVAYDIFFNYLQYHGLALYVVGQTFYTYDMLSVPDTITELGDVSDFQQSFSFDTDDTNYLVYIADVVVQNETVFQLSESGASLFLTDGSYYPENDKLSCQYGFELDDDVINTTNHEIVQDVTDFDEQDRTLSVEATFNSKTADVQFYNDLGVSVSISNFKIMADVTYIDYSRTVSNGLTTNEEVKSQYLTTEEEAVRYLKYLMFQKDYGKVYYTFYNDSRLDLGTLVTVTNLTDTLIVVQRTDSLDKFGGYDYKCVKYLNYEYDKVTKTVAQSRYTKGYTASITSTKGFIFKDSFSTVLECNVYTGANTTTQAESYTWTWGNKSRTGKTITFTQDDIAGYTSVTIKCETSAPTTTVSETIISLTDVIKTSVVEYLSTDSLEIPENTLIGQFDGETFQFDGVDIAVFDTRWSTEIPTDKTKYIYIRVTQGTTQTISLYSVPYAKSVSIVASNNGIFNVTERGVVQNDVTLTLVPKNFTLGTVEWKLGDDISTVTSDTLTIKYADISLPLEVTATTTYGDQTLTDTQTLIQQDIASSVQHYGLQTIAPTSFDPIVPTGFTHAGESVIVGDSYVYEQITDDVTDYIPYVYDGSAWSEITDDEGNVKDEYINLLSLSADTILNSGKDIPVSSSAIYGYFKNLSANSAIIDNLTVKKLSAISDSNWQLRINKEDGLVQTDSNGNTIVSLSPTGENIFKGSITATSGTFSGQLNTITLQTTLGGDTYFAVPYSSTATSLYGNLKSMGLSSNLNIKTGGTVNNNATTSLFINPTVVTHYRWKHHKSGHPNYYHSMTVWNITISIVTDIDTYNYVVKYQNIASYHTSSDGDYYPDYPTQMINYKTSYDYSNSVTGIDDHDSDVGTAETTPYPVTDLTIYDPTQERLFIKGLTTLAPSESNRVWKDSNGYLRIT